MSAKVSPIPHGYHTITPHIVVNDARKAVEFYKRAFGAEVRPFATDAGRQGHAHRGQDRRLDR